LQVVNRIALKKALADETPVDLAAQAK
jgi:hypothetical protein